MENLVKYEMWLLSEYEKEPIRCRPSSPEDFDFKTLWIPVLSGNRTAVIDLNHLITGWENGLLYGVNGNCNTPYVILEIPKKWDDRKVGELAELVLGKMDRPAGYPAFRILKADDRLPIIVETILDMELK